LAFWADTLEGIKSAAMVPRISVRRLSFLNMVGSPLSKTKT
jgi:hypothetical protein